MVCTVPLMPRLTARIALGLTVCHIQERAVGGDATRLGHGGLQARGVDDVLPATAGIGLEVGSFQVHHPHLMRASHGNEQLRADDVSGPRGVEGYLCARCQAH